MKLAICGSMVLSPEMLEVGNTLIKMGHDISLPKFTEHYSTLTSRDKMHSESAQNKVDHDLIRHYFKIIQNFDAVLVVNKDRKGIENYVGGNSLIEMAFGHVLDKKIYLLNPIPEMSYTDEIVAMKPTILNGDLSKII